MSKAARMIFMVTGYCHFHKTPQRRLVILMNNFVQMYKICQKKKHQLFIIDRCVLWSYYLYAQHSFTWRRTFLPTIRNMFCMILSQVIKVCISNIIFFFFFALIIFCGAFNHACSQSASCTVYHIKYLFSMPLVCLNMISFIRHQSSVNKFA